MIITYNIPELKALYLMAWDKYFEQPLTINIVSPKSKHNKSFFKLKKILEEEKIDANKYIGFTFAFAETKPTPGSISKREYIDEYLYQNGKDYE